MWGLEVRGSSGVLQVSQDYSNLHLVKAATIPLQARGGSTAYRTQSLITIDEPGNNPVIAFRSSAPLYLSRFNQVSPGVYRIVAFSTAGAGTNVSYYIFDTAPAPTGGWGMEVYADDGSVAFTTNRLYFNVAGETGSNNFGIGGVNRLDWDSPNSSRTYAVVQSQLAYSHDSSSFDRTEWNAMFSATPSGFVVQNTETYYLARPGSGSIFEKRSSQYVFVDVTGF